MSRRNAIICQGIVASCMFAHDNQAEKCSMLLQRDTDTHTHQHTAPSIGQQPHWKHMPNMGMTQQHVVAAGHSLSSSHLMGLGLGGGVGLGLGDGFGPGFGDGLGSAYHTPHWSYLQQYIAKAPRPRPVIPTTNQPIKVKECIGR